MEKKDLKNGTTNSANNVFTNEFGDRIVSQGGFYDIGGYKSCYSILIDGNHVKSVESVKTGKSFINQKRGTKCKWTGSVE